MSCNADFYKNVFDRLVDLSINSERALEYYLGQPWLAYAAIAALIIPLALLFVRAQYILVPKVVRWYYDQTIIDKAKKWFTDRGLAPLGFRHSTAIISVLAGAVFYALIRAAAAFPNYYYYSVPALVLAFIAIAILGYFVSGRVPNNDRARNRYFKRFYSPTVTALGIALANVLLDFLITLGTLAVNYMAAASS